MNYIVFYVEGCIPKIKQFYQLSKAKLFINKFNDKSDSEYKWSEDNWIDGIIYGEVISGFKDFSFVPKMKKKVK